MKAILVIDIPEDYTGSVIDVKLYGKEKTVHEKYVNKLKPMPQKIEVEVNGIDDLMRTELQLTDIFSNKIMAEVKFETDKLIALGWNSCVDEIVGEQNDNC